MKNYICIWMLLYGMLVSCSEDFLNVHSSDQIGEREALSSQENLYIALNGIHSRMVAAYLGNQACGGEQSLCIVRDCLGEDLVHPNLGNTYYVTCLRWSDHRNETSVIDKFPFVFYYHLIYQANLILEAADKVVVTDTVQMDGIKGEAYCFRAWAHFQLVQLYGKRYEKDGDNSSPGITYRKSSVLDPLPRNTVEECYTYVQEDLDKAIGLLKEYIPVEVTHFSLKVAYGLKARITLAQQNYQEAARCAGLAIEKAEAEGFQLMKGNECLNGFSKILSNTKEALWASHTLESQSIAFYSFYAYMSWNFNSTAIRKTPRCINSVLYDQLALTDIRRAWWDPTGAQATPASSYTRAKYQNRKFEVEDIANSAGDFAYMRLAELYLMKAEALARSGQETEARTTLRDFVMTRDPDYQLSSNTGDKLCEEIMTHRRIELWGEGFRFTDLKRLNLPLNRNNSNQLKSVCSTMEVSAGDARWQWLIPKDEIDASMGIVQQND